MTETITNANDSGRLTDEMNSLIASAANVAATGAQSVTNSKADSLGVLESTGNSKADSLGVLESTGNSKADSLGVLGSTANSKADSLGIVAAEERVARAAGTKADNTIPNNAQAAGGKLVTATGGPIWIEQIELAKDATALTGPTNLEISTDNVYGPTGAGGPVAVLPITDLQANERVNATAAGGTAMKPFKLESGKAIWVHGDDAAGTSAGNYSWTVLGRPLTAGAVLTP